MAKPIVILCGPTATGKTALSIALAQMLQGEIVSADSIQVYRGLDIGSAKPTLLERNGIPHHLIDVADVTDAAYSVARYRRSADIAIEDICARGKLPIIAGGTGLYINALSYPLRFTEVAADPAVRARLVEEEERSPGSLHARLKEVDARRAAQLHPNDKKRIIRALEIYELSGKQPTCFGDDFANVQGAAAPYEALLFGLTMDREALYERINKRVDDMMRQGLLEETKQFVHLPPGLPALQGLGYKQLLQHLRGELSLEEAVALIKQETRRFAKRQWTWFKRDTRIRWYDMGGDHAAILEEIHEIIMNEEGCRK